MTLKLEDNNTKEVLPLLWRFWTPRSGFPDWWSDKRPGNPQGIWLWGPAGFDYISSRELRETDIPVLEGTNKILYPSRPRGEEQRPLATAGHWPKLPASTGGPPGRCELARTHHWDGALKDPRAGSSQAKLPPGKKCNANHQQIIGLKLYWARPCPPDQDPVPPIKKLTKAS